MLKFRILLIIFILSISIYTGIVIFNHSLNIFPIFFGDIITMAWPGQFNLDFMCLLILLGLWISWRHHFSPVGLILGLLGLVGGTMFLAPYLLIISYSAKGNINEILLGKIRGNK
jgi:hypothetical protein